MADIGLFLLENGLVSRQLSPTERREHFPEDDVRECIRINNVVWTIEDTKSITIYLWRIDDGGGMSIVIEENDKKQGITLDAEIAATLNYLFDRSVMLMDKI